MGLEQAEESSSSHGDGHVTGNSEAPIPNDHHEAAARNPPTQRFFKKAQTKTGLDAITLILMFKGALPPTIALAFYQWTAFADEYTTLGYLTAIMSLLALAIQPRAKFCQAMFISLLFTCTGAALALLQIKCTIAARNLQNPPNLGSVTGSSGSRQAIAYSSSACVVASVWLFFALYVINVIRAKRPQLMLPCIQYSIFAIVTSTYAPSFGTMSAGESFVRRLLLTYLTGFGFATGVSLFVVPITSRAVAEKQIAGMLGLMKASLAAQGTYMESLTESHRLRDKDDAGKGEASVEAKAGVMRANVGALGGLFAKLKLETGFAKKEIGYGKLRPGDYSEIVSEMQKMLLPIVGMSTFMDIMQTAKSKRTLHEHDMQDSEAVRAIHELEAEEWDEVISSSHDQYAQLQQYISDGMTHIGLALEVIPKPKKRTDVEGDAGPPQPGSPDFAISLRTAMSEFAQQRKKIVRDWCTKKGIELPDKFFEDEAAQISLKDTNMIKEAVRHKHNQQQLYLVLYMGYLNHSICSAVLGTCKYADAKVTSGQMDKRRLINPGWRRTRKLVSELFDEKDSNPGMNDGDDTAAAVYVGDSMRARKDPEHLPPSNLWEKGTDYLRMVPRILQSSESNYGFRAAVAAISIGILAFIFQTRTFFLQERGTWALIMTAIGMDTHAGRGIFGFVCRILGTVVAMIASLLIWYIGYRQPGAIIPVFYIFLLFCTWFLLKNPTLTMVAIISMVTTILILGYALQDEKIGKALLTSNGQNYHAIYLLAPYRLVAVIIGLSVAFIWTYFPYPVTTHGTLRKDLGETLYLMANYYSCVHTTAHVRLTKGSQADETRKGSPTYKLAKARQKVFSKIIVNLNKCREHSKFTKWEPTFGGKFPKETYDDLITTLQHMFNYTSLISYSTNAFVSEPEAEESRWLQDFRDFTKDLKLTSHDMTSTLCLVSASITNSQPLPPYLRIPEPFKLSDKLSSVDPEIMSVNHIDEPCYAAFAVLEVASSLVTEEMGHVVKKVQELVGEVDFSFHIISTSDSASLGSTLLDEERDEKGKKD